MSPLEIFLTGWFIAGVSLNVTNTLFRIVTERDLRKSWKEEAVTSLLAAIIQGAVLVWMLLTWWL